MAGRREEVLLLLLKTRVLTRESQMAALHRSLLFIRERISQVLLSKWLLVFPSFVFTTHEYKMFLPFCILAFINM